MSSTKGFQPACNTGTAIKDREAARYATMRLASRRSSQSPASFLWRHSQIKNAAKLAATKAPRVCVQIVANPVSAPATIRRFTVRSLMMVARAAKVNTRLNQWCVASRQCAKAKVRKSVAGRKAVAPLSTRRETETPAQARAVPMTTKTAAGIQARSPKVANLRR